jgi:hypothetical protein
MVGISTGKGFTALRNVDQFALLGISPTTRLSFDELLKQAVRVAVLLHPDKIPPNVNPPFTSATANDLKCWLQLNATSEADRKKAVKAFYFDVGDHRGLIWRPYLKDKNGALVSRTDTAIWQPPGSTTPPSALPKKRKRKSQPEEQRIPVPGKRQKTQSGRPDFRPKSGRTDVPRPEKEQKPNDTKPSFQGKPKHYGSANDPKPEERGQKTGDAQPSSQRKADRSGSAQDSRPETEPKWKSSKPDANQRDYNPPFPPDFQQKYGYRSSAYKKDIMNSWSFEELCSAFNRADDSTPGSRAEPKRKDRDDQASPPPSTSSPNSPTRKPNCSDDAGHAVPERERRAYGTKPSAREKSSGSDNASGPIPERSRNTYATKPMFREDFTKAEAPHTSLPLKRTATPG